MNDIIQIIEEALQDRFNYDLEQYLNHINRLLVSYDNNIILNKDLTIDFFETILEMLEGIRDSFNRDNVTAEIKLKLISVIIPIWNIIIKDSYFKEKGLDDTLLTILAELQLKKTFNESTFERLIDPYKNLITDYDIIKKRAWV